MTFEIKFSKQATKFLRKLPKDVLARVKSKFRNLSEKPFRYLEHLESDNYYKFRIGEYRALIDLDFANKILWVRVFDKRSRVYK